MLKITKLTNQITTNIAILVNSQSPNAIRHVSCTASLALDQKWREQKGLPPNSNSFGPLTNLPDYTFLDGRTTPLGSNQKKRVKKQQETAAKIVELSGELKFAKERHARLKAEEATKKQRIMQSKLKPKGHLLLEKK